MEPEKIIRSIFERESSGNKTPRISPLLKSQKPASSITEAPTLDHSKVRRNRNGIHPFSLFRKGAGVGLEIRHHEVRLVRVEGKSDKWVVTHMDRESIRDAEFGSSGWFQEVRGALEQIVKRTGGIREKIVVGCAGPSIIIRRLELSGIAEPDIPAAVLSSTAHWSPFPAPERETRWTTLAISESSRAAIVQIGQKVFMENVSKILKEIGLRHVSIGHVGMGLGKVASFFRADPERGFAVVEIDPDSTLVTIMDRHGIWLSREIGFGTQHFLRALQSLISIGERRIALTKEEAQKYLDQYGLLQELPDDPKRPEYTNKAPELLRAPLEKIQVEIRRTIDYYREHIHGNPVERVFLQGLIRGLPGSHTVIPAGLPASLEGPGILTDTGARLDPTFTAAAGLASLALQNISWKVVRDSAERKHFVATRPLPIAIVIGILLFALTVGASSLWANREKHQLAKAQDLFRKNTTITLAHQKTLAQIQEISAWNTWTSQSKRASSLWAQSLQILLTKLTPDIRLMRVEGRILEDGSRSIEMDGEISDRSGNLEIRALSFIENIQKEKGVQSASISRTSLKSGAEIPTLSFHGSIRVPPVSEGNTP